MQLAIKIMATVAIVLAATGLAKRYPALAGLVGVMPLTGALVLAFVCLENRADPSVAETYARGALWGLVPVVLFYLAAWWCLRRGMGLAEMMAASFGIWGIGAVLHRYFIK